MKRFLLAISLLLPVNAFAADAPGLITEEINAPHHGRTMPVAIWYPGSGGTQTLFAENPIFVGGQVMQDAKPTPGKHPVILLSHGMGGSYLSLNWLASGLAAKGPLLSVSITLMAGSKNVRWTRCSTTGRARKTLVWPLMLFWLISALPI